MKYITIGSNSHVEIHNSTKPLDLNDRQAIVGGNIEFVALKGEVGYYINEEGKIDGIPRNDLATAYWELCLSQAYGDKFSGLHDYISGPAIIEGTNSEDGDSRSLTDEEVNHFTDFVNEWFETKKRREDVSI